MCLLLWLSLIVFFLFVWYLVYWFFSFVFLFDFCLFVCFCFVCSCLFLFVLVCSFFCYYFPSLFSHYLFLFVCMLRDWTNYLFVWLFAGVIWLRVFSPFPPNRSNPFNHLLTHSLTHSFFVVSSQCVCARVYVCLWLCERACVLCSVVEITPAAMAGYFVKCAAMPELFLRELVFLCLLVCVLVLVSSCVIVLCACAFTCSCVLVCVCEYMCVCSQFNKCNVNVINENTWKLVCIRF